MGPLLENNELLITSAVCRACNDMLSYSFTCFGALRSIAVKAAPLPVPQALSLAWHAEAIPVVGEVAVNKQYSEKCNEMD